jgi:hypothetical protein
MDTEFLEWMNKRNLAIGQLDIAWEAWKEAKLLMLRKVADPEQLKELLQLVVEQKLAEHNDSISKD